MSYQCVQAVLRSQVPSQRKLTLVALAEKATADGSTMYRSVQDLADATSKSWRQVIRDLKWCEDEGIIAEVNGRRLHGPDDVRQCSGGRGHCPRYRLNMEVLAAYDADEKPCHRRQGLGAQNPVTDDRVSRSETLSSTTETLSWVTPDPKIPKYQRRTTTT